MEQVTTRKSPSGLHGVPADGTVIIISFQFLWSRNSKALEKIIEYRFKSTSKEQTRISTLSTNTKKLENKNYSSDGCTSVEAQDILIENKSSIKLEQY